MRLATEEPGCTNVEAWEPLALRRARGSGAERCAASFCAGRLVVKSVTMALFAAISPPSRVGRPFAPIVSHGGAWSRDRPAGPSLSCCRGCSPAAVLDCVSRRLAEIDGHPAVIFPALSRSGGYLADASKWDAGTAAPSRGFLRCHASTLRCAHRETVFAAFLAVRRGWPRCEASRGGVAFWWWRGARDWRRQMLR